MNIKDNIGIEMVFIQTGIFEVFIGKMIRL